MVIAQMKANSGMLQGYRILDLTDENGLLCGKVLADLGAEVIKIERPGGDPARQKGPFYQDQPGSERSLFWMAFNQGKKGITLNLESPPGRELLKNMVKKADALVESFPPGYLDSLGLSYPDLKQLNPALVFTSITPFGSDGPHGNYKGPDLVASAMSGYMFLCGDTDRAPVRLSFPFAFPFAATEAAVGLLMALHYRHRTGQGQKVDVSAQQVMATMDLNAPAFYEFQKRLIRRSGPFRAELTAGEKELQVWPCSDGWISFSVYGGDTGARVNRALVAWMDSEGMADEFLKGIDWAKLDMAHISRAFLEEVEKRLGAFFLRHTKQELLNGALERRLILLPVYTMGEILDDPQMKAREFWMEVKHPELGATLTYPGPFVKASLTPVRPGGRAPLVGEHNQQVYQEWLGLSLREIERLKQEGVV